MTNPAHDYVTVSMLEDKHRVGRKTVIEIIKKNKLKPEFTQPFGRGVMQFFRRESIEPLVLAYVEKRKEKIEPASTPPIPAPAISLGGIEKRLDLIDASVSEFPEMLGKVTVQFTRLEAQNQLIFEMLKRAEANIKALTEALGATNPA